MPGRKTFILGLGVCLIGLPLIYWLVAPTGEANARQFSQPLTTGAPPPITNLADLPESLSANPETQLLRIFNEIEANRLDEALRLTETLIRQHPNYRLAYLIKGDLLLARARPIDSFGALKNAPADKVADLRAEAIVRLKAYRERPENGFVPRYLLQMRADQRFAVIVDAQRSRLYLYENDVANGGQPRFVADYYVSQGKLGADKYAQGDKKTPIGVYHVTAKLPRKELSNLYGSGAFPINYPNEWDRLQGRGGGGIWLHGTPADTFARPPRASDGCVVLSNQDLDAIAKNLQVGLTPVIISPSIEWLSLGDWAREREELNAAIDAWRRDWESRDTERYLKHYSPRFKDLPAFAAHKKQVNAGKEWIKIGTENLSVFRSPGKDEMAVVTFDQDYRSSNLNNRMKKRQYWRRENGQWKIIYEGNA
ncbi:MAG: L,D-transpeptidase family protein [Zoogloeaceae bacterium]|jgi:murein L,D-transpeptidase YafK|nr:L,D-transpeptidase family protein [Zoogloeaceae bacterium]